MTPSEKIGQLIMVAAWSNKDSLHIKDIERLVQEWKIGGLIFFQGGPVRQALLTNHYQSLSKFPLMIGIDGEWGLPMRLDSTIRFPRQMTMAAIPDDSSVYLMGAAIADHCRRLGIHVNFAPDADINDNPDNPIIGSRSFGDERESVARKSLLYMDALQDRHILASGKHFPGHGNADSDSHLMLPIIHQSRSGLDSMEFYPFRKLIDNGLGSVMVAHLNVPALDSTPELPSTLSKPIVEDLLKGEFGFKGLVFTDALNMKAVSAAYPPGMLDRAALLAGNDVLLYCEDVPMAVKQITEALDSGEITMQQIDARVRKVLMAKQWCGLDTAGPIRIEGLIEDLNSNKDRQLQRRLYEQSLTVLENHREILPLQHLAKNKVAVVSIGALRTNAFQQTLCEHVRADRFAQEKDAPASAFTALFDYLSNYDLVVLSLHGTTMKSQTGYGIPENVKQFIDTVLKTRHTVLVDFGNAYTLTRFRNLKEAEAVVLAYEDFSLPQELAAQLVVGSSVTNARLPIRVTDSETRGAGVNVEKTLRLKRSLPEELGIPSENFLPVDSIVHEAITAGAMPGCQLMVVKDGHVIFDKAYGYQSWDSLAPVKTTDLYDIASITKVAATALATMKTFDEGHFKVNQPLSRYLPELTPTNKKDITIRDVMAHQAGLQAWIPFWRETTTDGSFLRGVYAQSYSDDFPYRVCDSMYLRKDYRDSLRHWLFESALGEKGKYVYSDLGPVLMQWTVEKHVHESMDVFLEREFYKPLQLSHSGFMPYADFPIEELVPTENDTAFRHRLLRGDVHDPTAALQGGVSGNAGLFSNAFDLAVIFQMLLKKGWYGGEQLLKPSTVELFTSRAYANGKNRRGLLFDKPEPDPAKSGPTCPEASPATFGHQGFTGTCVWADPKNQLIFIFLSNRIHPDVTNDKLVKMNVRTRLQGAVYKAVTVN